MDIVYPYVCIDTETNGLNSETDEIVEVVAIEFNESKVIGRTIKHLCRPLSGSISASAQNVHGISYDMVKDERLYIGDIQNEIAEFVGDRIVIGHNIKSFDMKFLKINFKNVEDTLEMCRKKYRSGNNLKSACKRVNLQWDDSSAHRAEYDVMKTIELFIKMKGFEDKMAEKENTPSIFSVKSGEDVVKEVMKKPDVQFGVIVQPEEKVMVETMPYSYSRLSLYIQCPFKWYMRYIRRYKDSNPSYLQVGSLCHSIAEEMGKHCLREQFAIKYGAYCRIKNEPIRSALLKEVASFFSVEESKVDYITIGRYLHSNKDRVEHYYPGLDLQKMSSIIDERISEDSYERYEKPDVDTFISIVNREINKSRVSDAGVISEVKLIMSRFYDRKNFYLYPGEVSTFEKSIAFNREYKRTGFFDGDVYMRAKIDVLGHISNTLTITDYKSSRKMITSKDIESDRQLLTYMFMMSKIVPGGIGDVIIRIEYLRYGVTVERYFNSQEVAEKCEEARLWIESVVQSIETEMTKVDELSFKPNRNEYCGDCQIAEDGLCPLFDKRTINSIDDPVNFIVNDIDNCVTAWKRIEVNKLENTRLLKQCKNFMDGCSSPVVVDENAKLGYYIKQKLDIDTTEAVKVLLSKGVDIKYILQFCSLTEDNFMKIMSKKGVEISEQEMDVIAKKTTRSEFKALTEDEYVEGGYL